MPQVDVRFDFLSSRIHYGADNIGVEDEHPPFSTSVGNKLASFYDEASFLVESYLHSLVYNLAYQHQILHADPLANMAQRYVSYVLDDMDCVVASFHESRLLRFS